MATKDTGEALSSKTRSRRSSGPWEKRVLFVFVFMHEICVCLFGELNYVVAFEFVCVCIGSYLVSLKRKLFFNLPFWMLSFYCHLVCLMFRMSLAL